MNVKIECPCGARYSFEVEPRDGRMPSPVQCPVCHADGTEAANKMIAEKAAGVEQKAPRLRIHSAAAQEPAATPTAAQEGAVMCARHPGSPAADYCVVCHKPICAECMASYGYLCSIACRREAERAGMQVPVFKGQRRLAEEASMRRGAWLTGAVVGLVVLLLGGWAWYAFSGSRPHLSSWLKMTGAGPAHVEFLGRDKILIVTAGEAALRDLSLKKVFWSAKLGDNPAAPGAAAALAPPQVLVFGADIWICLGSQVDRLDAATGTIKQTIPVKGNFVSFSEGFIFPTPGDASLLVVSAPDETHRIALSINVQTGEASSREIAMPRKEKQTLPDDLPRNVAPTAGVLVSQALEEEKFNKPLDAMSSEFFSAGVNLVELRVKLLETKLTYAQSIKPRGPSELNGQTTASTSSSSVAEELFNDIKRSQTGGVRRVDQSRYEVRLRRWTGDQPVEWKGEVTGAPSFFPLSTVDLLTAGNALIIFDKENNKLFESKLTYPVGEAFTTGNLAGHLTPAAERTRTLYFFDQGVLTALALPSGDVRWRLTSFGVSGIQFDDQGMLYVNSTTAGPEDIQYADTVRVEKIHPVLLKVDPADGKILWKAEQRGQQCLVSGKYLYGESVEQGGLGIANALGEALNAPPNDSVAFHLYRIDPATGEALWDLYYAQRPANLAVQDNRILLRFGDDLELFKFLTF
jgi:hypothetical protein